MAFVETSSWQTGNERTMCPSLTKFYLPSWMDHSLFRLFHWQRPAGMALALLLHVLLAWLVLTRTGMGAGEGSGMEAGSALKMITLSDSMADLARPQQEMVAPSSTVSTRTQGTESETDLDLTGASDIPPEWSVTRIKVSRPAATAPANPLSAPSPMMAARAGSGSGRAGGARDDAYDPYAGASPMRRDEVGAQSLASPVAAKPSLADRFLNAIGFGSATADMPEINQPVLDQMKWMVRHRFPALRGSVTLSARISPTGQVLELIVRREDVGPEALALIRQTLIGRALVQISAGATNASIVDLPPIRFG